MSSVSFPFVNTKRVSSTPILFEQFMRRCVKKVGELIRDQMENFNARRRKGYFVYTCPGTVAVLYAWSYLYVNLPNINDKYYYYYYYYYYNYYYYILTHTKWTWSCVARYCAKVHCVCQSCQPWASKTQFLRPHCIKTSRSDNCGYMINEIVTEKLFTRPCNLVSQLVQEALFVKRGEQAICKMTLFYYYYQNPFRFCLHILIL